MASFKEAYSDYYESARKYDFIVEISPGIWKVSRKSDRAEYLAQDVTDTLFANIGNNPPKLTDYGQLLVLDDQDVLKMVKLVLNHPNLVCLVDCFALHLSPSGRPGKEQWFSVWDYCDAGNLGNLFVPSQPRPRDRTALLDPENEEGNEEGERDTEMPDASPNSEDSEDVEFLPESFCWHVLTSLLGALAWLHDGVRDVVQKEDGSWERQHEQLDWPPMLHRNITPQNIFVTHPRRGNQYGPVKLGNYGRMFVSGHCQISGENEAPSLSKAIGPPPDRDFVHLGDLIAEDAKQGSFYPHQPNQPYTMISEYRAVGELIQGMMIEPTGSEHIKRIQSQSARLNLQKAKYTACLKNFVVKLMEIDPWNEMITGKQQRSPAYITSDIYCEAQQGNQWFMSTENSEAKANVRSRTADVEGKESFDSFQKVHEMMKQFS